MAPQGGVTLVNDEPPRRWELSAPESGVLLWGPQTRSGEALKLALLELVVRQVLRLESVRERRLAIFSRTVTVLAPGPGRDQPSGRTLRGVLEATPPARTYPDGTTGAAVAQWARAVVARYQRSGGYAQAEVLPALEQRGLYRRERYRRLGLFEASRWTLTPEGMSALAELKALLDQARALFGLGTLADPAAVRSHFERTGAAVLLLPGLFPQIRLRQGQGPEGTTDAGSFVLVDIHLGGGDERPSDETEPGGDPFDLDALAGVFGPGPLDGLDAAFAAIDAGVDSGGGGDGDGDGE
jgi:hypothetical protein